MFVYRQNGGDELITGTWPERLPWLGFKPNRAVEASFVMPYGKGSSVLHVVVPAPDFANLATQMAEADARAARAAFVQALKLLDERRAKRRAQRTSKRTAK